MIYSFVWSREDWQFDSFFFQKHIPGIWKIYVIPTLDGPAQPQSLHQIISILLTGEMG